MLLSPNRPSDPELAQDIARLLALAGEDELPEDESYLSNAPNDWRVSTPIAPNMVIETAATEAVATSAAPTVLPSTVAAPTVATPTQGTTVQSVVRTVEPSTIPSKNIDDARLLFRVQAFLSVIAACVVAAALVTSSSLLLVPTCRVFRYVAATPGNLHGSLQPIDSDEGFPLLPPSDQLWKRTDASAQAAPTPAAPRNDAVAPSRGRTRSSPPSPPGLDSSHRKGRSGGRAESHRTSSSSNGKKPAASSENMGSETVGTTAQAVSVPSAAVAVDLAGTGNVPVAVAAPVAITTPLAVAAPVAVTEPTTTNVAGTIAAPEVVAVPAPASVASAGSKAGGGAATRAAHKDKAGAGGGARGTGRAAGRSQRDSDVVNA